MITTPLAEVCDDLVHDAVARGLTGEKSWAGQLPVRYCGQAWVGREFEEKYEASFAGREESNKKFNKPEECNPVDAKRFLTDTTFRLDGVFNETVGPGSINVNLN
jgi:hypothetical protein